MAAPRVVIVDDHTLLNEAFRRLLEPECEVVGTYDDPHEFLRDVGRLRPDVAVLDIDAFIVALRKALAGTPTLGN